MKISKLLVGILALVFCGFGLIGSGHAGFSGTAIPPFPEGADGYVHYISATGVEVVYYFNTQEDHLNYSPPIDPNNIGAIHVFADNHGPALWAYHVDWKHIYKLVDGVWTLQPWDFYPNSPQYALDPNIALSDQICSTVDLRAGYNQNFTGYFGYVCNVNYTDIVLPANCVSPPTQTALTIALDPPAGGKVTGQGISCGTDCQESYDFGSSIQVRATKNKGWKFQWWKLGASYMKKNPYTILMDSDKTLTASFIPATGVADEFVFPVLANGQNEPLQNTIDPIGQGWRGSGVGKKSAAAGHLGQDYIISKGNSAGQPVYAIANGVVVEVLKGSGIYGWCDNKDHGWGAVVVILHYNPLGFSVPNEAVIDSGGCGTDLNPKIVYSLYGHLAKSSIQDLYIGKSVKIGEQIGLIGAYGVDQISWTTNHLHFEIKDEVGFLEGTWYKSHPKQCPVSTTYKCGKRVINGVGTAYSYLNGFAPHRYNPSVFIPANTPK